MSTIEATGPSPDTQFRAPNPELLPDEMPLPPLQEGFVRLYRGDVVDAQGRPIVEEVDGRSTASETAGRWFTNDPNAAEGYGAGRVQNPDGEHPRTRFIDVPADVAHTYNTRNLSLKENLEANGTAGNSEEWLLPADIIDQAHEYQVKYVDRQYEPEVEAGLHEILADPSIVAILKLMDNIPSQVQDIINDRTLTTMVMEQFAIQLGQDPHPTEHTRELSAKIGELMYGVGSAHKQRYIGEPPVIEQAPEAPAPRYVDTGEW